MAKKKLEMGEARLLLTKAHFTLCSVERALGELARVSETLTVVSYMRRAIQAQAKEIKEACDDGE